MNEERKVAWPKLWPLPHAGEMVTHSGVSGFVDHLEYRLDDNIVVIILR